MDLNHVFNEFGETKFMVTMNTASNLVHTIRPLKIDIQNSLRANFPMSAFAQKRTLEYLRWLRIQPEFWITPRQYIPMVKSHFYHMCSCLST